MNYFGRVFLVIFLKDYKIKKREQVTKFIIFLFIIKKLDYLSIAMEKKPYHHLPRWNI